MSGQWQIHHCHEQLIAHEWLLALVASPNDSSGLIYVQISQLEHGKVQNVLDHCHCISIFVVAYFQSIANDIIQTDMQGTQCVNWLSSHLRISNQSSPSSFPPKLSIRILVFPLFAFEQCELKRNALGEWYVWNFSCQPFQA